MYPSYTMFDMDHHSEANPGTPASFVESLRARELPIHPLDASSFAEFVTAQNAPQGFLNRLVDSMQYKSEPAFERDFDEFGDMIMGEMRDLPYSVAYFDRRGSGKWIYEKLRALGLHEAEHEFSYPLAPKAERDNSIAQDLETIADIIAPQSNVLIVDDFIISGTQIIDTASSVLRAQVRGKIATVYCAEEAEPLIKRNSKDMQMITLNERLKGIGKTITDQDFKFMHHLAAMYNMEPEQLSKRIPFFWTYYKVPDNVFDIFTEKSPYPLIRTYQYQQPYRT